MLAALLFTQRRQGLSAKFRNRLKIAVVSKSEKAIAKALNVTSYPALRVLAAGSSSSSAEAVHFKGKVSFFAIDLFLMDYAKPAATSDQGQGSKAAKGKDAQNKAKADKASDGNQNKAKADKASDGNQNKAKADKASGSKGAGKGETKAKEKQGDAANGAKSPRGKEDAKQSAQEPELPVYDSAKKGSRGRRGGEL
jgi:hypothetical protein